MKTHQFIHKKDTWNPPLDPGLNRSTSLVLVFGNDTKAIEQVTKTWPKAQIVGCSSSGSIGGEHVYDDAVVLTVLEFAGTELKVSSRVSLEQASPEEAARKILGDLVQTGKEPKAIIVFSCAFGNGERFVEGLRSKPASTVIVGGLAGFHDFNKLESAFIIDKDGAHQRSAIGVALYGPRIQVACASKAGAKPIGTYQTVKRSQGPVLQDLQSTSVLDYYYETLGYHMENTLETILQFPLEVIPPQSDEPLVRTPAQFNSKDKSITFATEIPPGSKVRLMIASTSSMVQAAHMTAAELKVDQPDGHFLAISCVNRKIVMGDEVEDEVTSVHDNFGEAKLSVSGFYSLGEITPDKQAMPRFQNLTWNLIYLSEKAA